MALFNVNYPFGLVLSLAVSAAAGLGSAYAQDNSAVAVAPQAALPASITATASPDWRDDIGTFKIGLVRGWSSDMSRLALTRVEAVFAKALGIPVRVVVFERFTSLMDAQADGRIDMAAYSARAYATLRLKCECVDAIATPTTPDGGTGQVAIIAGDPSRIPSLATLGRSRAGSEKIGRVTSAHISTQEMLRGTLVIGGKAMNGDEDIWVDYPDFNAAIAAYQSNEIDALVIPAVTEFSNQATAGQNTLASLGEGRDGSNKRAATALWRSPFWPFGPIAVRRNIALEARNIVLKTLEEIDVTATVSHAVLSENLAGPFRQVDAKAFESINLSIRQLVGQNAKWR